MDESTGVTAGASTAVEESPSSTPADTGGQGAISGGEVGNTPSSPSVAGNVDSADAGAEELPITEEELAQAPEQWREKFTSLLSGYKSLDKDHRALKGQYQPLADFGDVDNIKSQLEFLDGLYGYARDEYGNILRDEQTGLPLSSTMNFVSKLEADSPALAEQLF